MDSEQLYVFVDKSGHCFEDFQLSAGTGFGIDSDIENDGERRYRDVIGAWLRSGKKFSVGDMLVFRDDLQNAGFKWGVDFYVKKITS